MDDTPKRRNARRITSTLIDQSKPAPIIVARFGGLMAFCDATGFKPSTVQTQMQNGFFPNRIHSESGLSLQAYILRCATERGVKMAADDFIEKAAA